MKADLVIKPLFTAFVLKPIALLAIPLLILAGAILEIASNIDVSIPMLPAVLALLILVSTALHTLSLLVRFKKTSYSFYPNRIVLRTGGIFGERTVDLQIKNITQVSTTIPFLQYRIFKTGHVFIQAAGSANTEISMQFITTPLSIYNEVAARMQKNGFTIARQHEIQRESPGLFGTIIQMGEAIATILFVLGYLLISNLFNYFTGEQSISANDVTSNTSNLIASGFFSPILITIITLFSLGALIWFVLHCIDLARRNYILYDDVIDYSDGFLTKRKKFIPIENLADVTLSQTLLRRIFGISDLIVSCQGADTNIAFHVMPRADLFKSNLEQRIRNYKTHQIQQQTNRQFSDLQFIDYPEINPNNHDPQNRTQHTQNTSTTARPSLLNRPTNLPTLELKISLKRAIGGSVLTYAILAAVIIPLIFITSIILGKNQILDGITTASAILAVLGFASIISIRETVNHVIAFYATRYRIDDHKLGLHHTMFNKRHVEFTLDKVTSVTVSHDVFDRIFKTTSIAFHSIGTSEVVVFKHLPNGHETTNNILARLGLNSLGLNSHQPNRTLRSLFSPNSLLRSHLELCAAATLWITGSLIAAVFFPIPALLQLTLVLLLIIAYYAYNEAFYKHARLELFENYLHLRQGLFKISKHYAPFSHIKHIQSTRYFGLNTGDLQWAIAGGTSQTLAYIHDVHAQHDQLDAILYTQPTKPVRQPENFTSTTLASAQRSTPNTLTPLLLISILLFPLILLLPITIPITLIRTRRYKYHAENLRITATSGRIYPHRQTILYNRIDHLTTARGFLNNIFKNSSIGVATTGSTGTDLTITDIKNATQVYDIIKQNLPTDL